MNFVTCGRARLLKAALFAGAALTAAPAFAQNTQLEEIVVTAQKREQNLQDVPISITALSANAIQANRIVDVRDLNAVAPNLTVRVAPGGTAQANYSMRGLVTAGSAPGSDKGISVYVDGVYLQSAIGSIFELADVERIEVLKGPQGTLFGRNATGGAINIVTRNPSGRFGIHQEISVGNYDQFRTKTRLDLPQVGPISAAVTYVHSERRGDVENLGAGTAWDYRAAGQGLRVSPKYLGDEDINSVSAAVRFDLLQDLDLVYKFDYSQNRFSPEAMGVTYIDSPLVSAILGSQPNQGLLTPITSERPDAVNNAFATRSFVRNWGHNLTARYQLTDQISLKNIFAYRQSYVSTTYQLEGLGGLQFTPLMSALGLGGAFGDFLVGSPWILVANTGEQADRQWSDEFQVNVNHKWFALTAGYIHFEDHVTAGGFEGVANVTAFSPLPGFVLPDSGNRHTYVAAKSDAVFAQIEGHVTSQLDLIGGWRLTRDDKEGIDRTVPGFELPIAYKNTRPTWLAGVNYRPNDSILAYAKYATGFISGGFLAGRAYTPETAKSYEIGLKTDLLDRRLRSNLALFDVKYGDLQFQTSGANLTPPSAAAIALVNGGNAKAKGFEWENTFLPVEGLTLTANVGYTDFKYTSVDPIVGTLDTFLPVSRPKWTVTGSAQYESPEVYRGGHILARVDFNYRSKTIMGITTPGGDQRGVESVTVDSSWLVNGRLALTDVQMAGAKGQLALWGRNLFDNRDVATGSALLLTGVGNVFSGSYERARTFGVDLIFDF